MHTPKAIYLLRFFVSLSFLSIFISSHVFSQSCASPPSNFDVSTNCNASIQYFGTGTGTLRVLPGISVTGLGGYGPIEMYTALSEFNNAGIVGSSGTTTATIMVYSNITNFINSGTIDGRNIYYGAITCGADQP
jgi:hypothetical protein